MTHRLYFSFQSPFSWMALRELEARVPGFATEFEYIPFWDPDDRTRAGVEQYGAKIHYTRMSKAKHLYILHDTKRLASGFGHDLTWPVDVNPWWEPSALGWLKARESGCERAFYDVVTEVRWNRGADISDPVVLRPALDAAGLEGAALMAAVDDPHIRELGVQALVSAHRDAVFGIPLFQVGRRRFWGVDRIEEVIDAVEDRRTGSSPDTAETTTPVAVLATIGSMDADSPGGCG
ncbi:DsbA family protein [Actinoplanes sp. NEAU-A12]|uniref:2-hydroxychromene-2-carboxylate isomerase n=1 Tax=Actinoplanes sandaracinus TaxID=3045177 RepID=A0ABT6WHV8_9ACTN|nr:DsbA family protein [Actinoplanes sandaracinus]MDI6099260.1 DsbA family protein [Actinoplanes sandaracinus]